MLVAARSRRRGSAIGHGRLAMESGGSVLSAVGGWRGGSNERLGRMLRRGSGHHYRRQRHGLKQEVHRSSQLA
jgi:hypothetical protein